MSADWRQEVFEGLNLTGPYRRLGYFIFSLIVVSVAVLFLATVNSLPIPAVVFQGIEAFVVIVFSMEFLLRLYLCRYSDQRQSRLLYALRPMSLVDLLAILPYYMAVIFPVNLIALRLLRLFRLVRILKIGNYSESLDVLVRVFDRRKEALVLVAAFGLVMLVVMSLILFNVEHEVQPDEMTSVLSSLWWSFLTMTRVGYGDFTPVSEFGQFIGAAISLLGLFLCALPVGIIGSALVEEVKGR